MRSLDPAKTLRRRIVIANVMITDAVQHDDPFGAEAARIRLRRLEDELESLERLSPVDA